MENPILKISDERQLWSLTYENIEKEKRMAGEPFLTRPEFEHIFNLRDAIWIYQGEPSAKRPHALLATGDHSNGFFDCAHVLSFSNLCRIMAGAMVQVFPTGKYWFTSKDPIDWIVGTATSSTDLSKDVANILGGRHVPLAKNDKLQVWPDRQVVEPNSTVFDFEELMTTSTGVRALRKGIQDRHEYPIKFGPIVVLVHRTNVTEIDGSEVFPVFHYDIQNWKLGKDCPYCAAGSEAIPPKTSDNWARLHGRA